MKFRSFIGAFLFLALAAACSKQTVVPSPQEDLLYQLEGFWRQQPDSAMRILDTLDLTALSEKERAHYCLLKAQMRDARYLYDDETDSLLQEAKRYFVGGKDKWFEAETCEALSRVLFKRGEGNQVKLDWQLKALQSIEKCKHLDPRLPQYASPPISEQEMIDDSKYTIHWRLGGIYVDNCYFEEGFYHMKEADRYYTGKQNYKKSSTINYSLGATYLGLHEYDSSMACFRRGLEASELLGDKELCAYYFYSMSLFYSSQIEEQHYESEEEKCRMLHQLIDECQQGLALYEEPMFKFKDGFYAQMAKAYYDLHRYDSCIYYSEQQLAHYKRIHFEIVPNRWYSTIFFLLYKSYDALGDKEKALENANRYWEMMDQMKGDEKALEKVKSDYDKLLETQQLEMEQQAKRYRLYLLVAFSLFALLFVTWMAFRYRKNKEIESLKYQETFHELQSKLETTTRQSQQALQQRALNLYKTHPDHLLEQLVAEFESFFPQALQKLKKAYPKLNETECSILMLSFMGFRMKEEAEILGLSENTVGKYRSNIRKKAGIHPVSDLFS